MPIRWKKIVRPLKSFGITTNTVKTCKDILTFLRNKLFCVPESQVTSLKGEKTSVHQQSLGESVAEETFADFA